MSTYLKKRFGHCTFAGGFCRTEGTAKEGRGEVRLGEGRTEKGGGGGGTMLATRHKRGAAGRVHMGVKLSDTIQIST